ncbi:hypothetical protein BDW02DRAFT_429282 [Decorospora gaudefroyi]|uniref:Uncharacterized protein n=1 Tax=Decorospora gaudefroyi TaxID=184978 RepID=A0A6A5K786_9PLEO|nr:hypothetical protein BDW02DRAFT_429282 [Decorospora gaudefroyi]
MYGCSYRESGSSETETWTRRTEAEIIGYCQCSLLSSSTARSTWSGRRSGPHHTPAGCRSSGGPISSLRTQPPVARRWQLVVGKDLLAVYNDPRLVQLDFHIYRSGRYD